MVGGVSIGPRTGGGWPCAGGSERGKSPKEPNGGKEIKRMRVQGRKIGRFAT